MSRRLAWVLLFIGVVAPATSCSSLPDSPEATGGTGQGGSAGTSAGTGGCGANQAQCSGVCTDTTANTSNCGSCGNVCPNGENCVASACTCSAGLARCGGACVNVTSDPMNCGACATSGGTVCPAPAVCRSGSCATDCGTLTDCNRSCVDPMTDFSNCGSCGHACRGGQMCQAGTCVCPPGTLDCQGFCVNALTDVLNCGGCGVQCLESACVAGRCAAMGGAGGGGSAAGAGSGSGGTAGMTSGGAGAGAGGAGAGGVSGAGAGSSGGASVGGAGNGGRGGAGAGGAGAGGAGASGGGTGGATSGCGVTASRTRITEIDVGATIVNNEDEAALMPLSISPIPGGGSRLAWMGNDSRVHVTTLDASDQVTGTSVSFAAHDFQDIHADANGGVILLTRDAMGGGTLNCGQPTNLCGTPPNPPIACYDMYLVRFDGGTETWATKLTNSSASLPPYSTGPTGPNVYMIWWYAHHGRIASDGTNYAAYFGAAISTTQSGCINIHQGDRAKLVNPSGAIVSGGFDWGCSHSGYERVVWDGSKYVYVCENDAPTSGKSGKIAFAPGANPLILPIDLNYTNMGDLVPGSNGGIWLTSSDVRAGQPANMNGLADVRLLQFTTGAPSQNIVLASDSGMNDRAPHLAAYGGARMIAAWETATATGNFARNNTSRRLYVQTVSRANGATEGAPLQVAVQGNRYHEFVSFPDGSVAFPAPGSSGTKAKILRILPCN